jgi:hypothetical protein
MCLHEVRQDTGEDSVNMTRDTAKMSGILISHKILFYLGFAWSFAIRLYWLFAHPAYAGDDALITFRHVENLVRHGQFVYNLGERVQGTTTPLYALILALVSWLPGGTILHAGVLNLVLDLALLVVIYRILTARQLPWIGAALVWILGSYYVILTASESRMETPLYVLLIFIAYLYLDRQRYVPMAVALGLLLVTRVDGLIAVAAFYAFITLDQRRLPWREGLVTLAVALPWYAFAGLYYGSVLPQTMLAKTIAYRNMYPRTRNLTYLWELVTSGYMHLRLMLWPFIVYAFLLSIRKMRFLLPLFLFGIIYFAAFSKTRTFIFPWYMVPLHVTQVVLAAVGFGHAAYILGPDLVAREKLRPLSLLVSSALVILLSVWMRSQFEQIMSPYWSSQPVGEAVGLWIRDNTPLDATVYTEPVGAIGYYSERQMLDAVGLVAPQVTPYIARSAMKGNYDNYAEAINALQPDYAVLREGEYSGFQEPTAKGRFDTIYEQVHRIKSYLIFRRSQGVP